MIVPQSPAVAVVPKGHSKIARRFNAGLAPHENPSPIGTVERALNMPVQCVSDLCPSPPASLPRHNPAPPGRSSLLKASKGYSRLLKQFFKNYFLCLPN